MYLCSICLHLGEAFIHYFLCNIGLSVHLSHCLSMGKLIVGYIGLDLGLHLKTAKLHKKLPKHLKTANFTQIYLILPNFTTLYHIIPKFSHQYLSLSHNCAIKLNPLTFINRFHSFFNRTTFITILTVVLSLYICIYNSGKPF